MEPHIINKILGTTLTILFILVPISFSITLFITYTAKSDKETTNDDMLYPFCIAFSAIFALSLIILVAILSSK